jgi:uncharacterized protein (TIGR00369 family)
VLDEERAARVLESFARQGLMRHLGAGIVRLDHGFCAVAADRRPELTQQHGFIHAGVTSALMDTAGGYAALSTFSASDSVLTVDFTVNLLAPARGAQVIAEAAVVRTGRTLSVCTLEAFVLAYDGRRVHVATGRQTLIRLTDTSDQPPPEGERP